MYLIVQIPCYNEENTLRSVIKDIPRSIPGIEKIEVLIINDGSTDNTLEVARALPVEHHILDFKSNRGLAFSFKKGLEKCLSLGADIIINTDGDNQYKSGDIPLLIKPILMGEADMVVGCRNIAASTEFGITKKYLHYIGGWVVRKISGTKIKDVTSGFRAFTREAAMRLVIFDVYTYTLESLIQAGNTPEIRLEQIEIGVNAKTRDSRLISSIPNYLEHSIFTILRMFIYYNSFKCFLVLTAVFYLLAFLFGLRSLNLFAVFLVLGGLSLLMGLFGLTREINRRLVLENIYLNRKILYDSSNEKNKRE